MSQTREENFKRSGNRTIRVALIGIVIVALILVMGSILLGRTASRATEDAVNSVSTFYLDELAGRREQVVESNLDTSIRNLQTAVGLMNKDDLSSLENMRAYQSRMKKIYELEKFAFIDEDGLIYTSLGMRTDIDSYPIDYKNITEPVVRERNVNSEDTTVIIATPLDGVSFDGKPLLVCFMEIKMDRMLEGISIKSGESDATFCNLYTENGFALTNMVLGGLAKEDNLLEALEHADFDNGATAESVKQDFQDHRAGLVTFTYNGIRESLSYVPVHKTDWMLTYLIRDSVISERIGTVSKGIIWRSVAQSILTALVLLGMFLIMLRQIRRTSSLLIEKETSEAENRVKQQEMEQRLKLQEQLLEQEKAQAEQDSMINALASDYGSVYYVDIDHDEGVCYRADRSRKDGLRVGEQFPYLETFRNYAEHFVHEQYREDFLEFIKPDNIREALRKEKVISIRYLADRGDSEIFEMLRMADVGTGNDETDHTVHAVGAGFSNVDRETRDSMAKNQALSDALNAAEKASRAKTAFLSSMSHEIRTPMNAIIGLDNIALSDPDLTESTRDHLEKINDSAQHLLSLINDILDMSRIESGRMILKNEEFSFPKLLEQINTMVSGQCSEKGLEYDCRVNGEIKDYYIGDDGKLRQIILNILSNAVKFTPEGGRIEFITEPGNPFEGRTPIRMIFRDTGIGMEPEFLEKIFDAFSQEDSSTTSKYGSSGLGMAITKNIVEMMNGTIEVESEKGAGSTFTVTVTLMDSDRSADGSSEEIISPKEMSVLVIDDDPIACEHASIILGKEGINAEIVTSGEEAIEKVKLRHARRDPYNLILVDWKMPGMDGIETTKEIRSLIGHESAIIILTAYRWDDVLEEAMRAGVDSFLSKPLFASSVLEEFNKAAGKKKALIEEAGRKADLTGRRILVAEDVPINAEIIMKLLQRKEIETEHAANGKEAVDMFCSSPEHHFDAILMDMRMPEMDGLEATRRIRTSGKSDAADIPIIALTANAFDEDVQRSLQAGLNAHLSKPVEPQNLYDTLQTLIRDDKPEDKNLE